MAVSKLDEDEKGISSIDTLGGEQKLGIVNEPGLYTLVLRYRKPEAKTFKYENSLTVARGLGFTQEKNGVEYVRWETVNNYLRELKFSQQVGKDAYIPENIFYRLAMKAKNETAEKFQTLIADEVILGVGLSAQNFK